ncbi:hypothetical protein FM038_025180 [Shewanella eurypsychrophilus]|uniref:Cell division protein FtsL n=1 Tax=Shewanella eurypsychrophilus TaxID=2593656 RepID=A0ABX6VD40_9GAMM|nr:MULTISPECIES: hypothetical protein [Shewanella]QFU25090.1 hypothetical protein FS418_26805 [Shewanella sp. YLB-09]QPG60262.1 hypothetical protein FM038_025180 [Shewanella eurypsychrophilus]
MLRFILSITIIYAFWLTYQDASEYFDEQSLNEVELAQAEVTVKLAKQAALLEETRRYSLIEDLGSE